MTLTVIDLLSSPAKANLYFTLILRPKLISELPKLNFATAVAIARAARTFGSSPFRSPLLATVPRLLTLY